MQYFNIVVMVLYLSEESEYFFFNWKLLTIQNVHMFNNQ